MRIGSFKAAFAAMLAAGVLVFSAGPLRAEDGVTAGSILFGQSAALNGPAGALGAGMNVGLRAAFAEVNAAGGINGRKLELTALDDGYEPDAAIANVRKLVDEQKVFALVGQVGTPTSSAVQPIATKAGVPFVGAFSGAGFLRNPELRNVVNIRASYDQETETWIDHLTKDLGINKIAIFYQDDSYGRAGLAGVQKAMDKRGLKLVASSTYARNTIAVKSALLEIRKAEPQAVVMVGAYKPCAEFIRLARQIKFSPEFVNISFVGSDALAKELGKDGSGVVVTQVVPFPLDTSRPVVAAYAKALAAVDPTAKPGFVSLEGYVVGRLTAEVLRKIEGEPTRKTFIDTLYKVGTFNLGGITLKFGPGKNQGMDDVYLTAIQQDGSLKPIVALSR